MSITRVKVLEYNPKLCADWDSFVQNSKNGTFHLTRKFIAYHKDRYNDCSLIFLDEHDQYLALLPAARIELPTGKQFVSHPGLSYGGLVMKKDLTLTQVLSIFAELTSYLIQNGYQHLHYKAIPAMYHLFPSEEDLYALYLAGAKIQSRHVLPTIPIHDRLEFQERRKRGAAKARKQGIKIVQHQDLAPLWNIISSVLKGYGASPVHTLTEIEELAMLFPENIKAFGAVKETELLGGVLIFETETVARAQYIAASPEGKNFGALDLLFEALIQEFYPKKLFFEFGTATTEGGKVLNSGICAYKEGFGARTQIQDSYLLDLNEKVTSIFTAAIDSK